MKSNKFIKIIKTIIKVIRSNSQKKKKVIKFVILRDFKKTAIYSKYNLMCQKYNRITFFLYLHKANIKYVTRLIIRNFSIITPVKWLTQYIVCFAKEFSVWFIMCVFDILDFILELIVLEIAAFISAAVYEFRALVFDIRALPRDFFNFCLKELVLFFDFISNIKSNFFFIIYFIISIPYMIYTGIIYLFTFIKNADFFTIAYILLCLFMIFFFFFINKKLYAIFLR